MNKPFKDLDEQISLLKSRGLLFKDEQKSRMYLLKNNYYNVVNCYSKFLQSNSDKYILGAGFEEIINIHRFDTELRQILLRYLLLVENYFKSIVSYCFSKNSIDDDFAYLKLSYYKKEKIMNASKFVSSLVKTIEKNKRERNAISHYLNNYNDIPMWVLVDFMDFGQVITMFSNLKDTIKHDIAKELNQIFNENLDVTTIRLSERDINMILENLRNVRNVLAHGNKMIDFKNKNNYCYISELHDLYSINKIDPKQDIYNTFVILRMFTEKEQFTKLNNSIINRAKKLDKHLITITANDVLKSYGFPSDWYLNNKMPE